MKQFYYPSKIKIGETIYVRMGWSVTFPEGKKLERGIYLGNGQSEFKYLREEKLIEGLTNKSIIQCQ